MTKRFIDISTLPKAWRKLKPSLKLTWYYLWNNCDASGVWEIDEDLFEFENGFELDIEKLQEFLPNEIVISNNLVLINNFIVVNYNALKEDYNPHKPAFRAILKNNLKLKPSLNQACFKLVDEDEDEEEDKDEKEKEKKIPVNGNGIKNGIGKKENAGEKIKPEKIIDLYHQFCKDLPKVQVLNKNRKSSIKVRLNEHGLNNVTKVFQMAGVSKFLIGENEKNWHATFDWLMNPSNFVKVLEGNYTGKNDNNPPFTIN